MSFHIKSNTRKRQLPLKRIHLVRKTTVPVRRRIVVAAKPRAPYKSAPIKKQQAPQKPALVKKPIRRQYIVRRTAAVKIVQTPQKQVSRAIAGPKTVIIAFTQQYRNCRSNPKEALYRGTPCSYHGIGDMIRGMFGMSKFCKANGYQLLTDFSLHPVSKFLMHKPHPYEALVHRNRNNIDFVRIFTMDKYLRQKFTRENPVLLSTNMSMLLSTQYDAEISQDIKDFVKSHLIPNAEFQACLNEYRAKIPFEKYSIIHYRLGDKAMITTPDIRFLENWYQHVRAHYEQGDVLITDSPHARTFIRKRDPKIFTFDHDTGHVGYETNEEKVRNTLVEFFLVSTAEKIKSYSTWSWVSGFVNSVHHTFDVPLHAEINLKF